MAQKIAIFGGKTSSLGFRAVGMDAYMVAEPEDAPPIWESIPKIDYAIIFITEPIYQVLESEVEDFPPEEEAPVVIIIPAVTGSRGLGLKAVKRRVEKAVGADVEVRES